MATHKLRYSRTDAEQTQAWDAGEEEYPDLPAEPALGFTDEVPDVCQHCGEPLGWHEQACEGPATKPADEPTAPALQASDGFTFALGSLALPITQEQSRPVVWRGHLKERHPATGLVQRVPVYRLDDGYWDCYREEELRVA
ncbi:hypothetical protein [Hymenobacter sp. BT559]|uniref:hypothetical protein n=1 Tax=Hymenobacter sp. BT559 TaxID=2795729 RepID=UPI0018EE0F00|nr:hypothetical protein [Hymenobacter sp. BT559]MBJ6141771.1 hypothetical protein [Hymenobacter sp. BT559]